MRQYLNFNFDWKFHQGEIERPTPKPGAETYLHSKTRCGLGVETKEYSEEDFVPVNIPHDYVLDTDPIPEGNPSHGSIIRENAWYRKSFAVNRTKENERFVIMFEGIGTKSEIWFNGHLVGRNTSAYNSFYVDITPYLLDDDYNLLSVHVMTDDFEGWWYEGAGIYRNVWLIQTDEVAVDVWGTWVNPIKLNEKDWNVEIETTIYNQNEDARYLHVKHELYNSDDTLLGKARYSQKVKFGKHKQKCDLMIHDPAIWSIENPNMSYMKTILSYDGVVFDEYITKFSFRTIEFDHKEGFFLNGEFTKIRGVCLHQDHANMGVAFNKSVWKYRLEILKEGGVNACRCAHGNPAPEFLDLCDEMGFLVMDENRWFSYSEESKRQLKSMVLRDRNHPSIIIWSIGNEEPLQTTLVGKRLISLMRGFIKGMDATRPVSLVLYSMYNPKTDISDVTCFNYQIENYDKFYELNGGKLILATEVGASDNNRSVYFVEDESKYNSNYATSYDKRRRDFSDSYFASIKASEDRKFVGGTFLWAGFEYRGESECPKLFCGVSPIDACGFKKDNFFMMKAIWNDETMLHIMPHWNFDENTPDVPVVIYTNVSEVELFLNGKSLGKKPSGKFNPPTWTVPYEKGTLKAVGYEDGKEVIVSEQTTTKGAKTLNKIVRNIPDNTGLDCVVVDFYMTDEDGRFVPDASNLLEFTTDENLEIVAISSGDPMDQTNARSKKMKMYAGWIQMIAKAKAGAKAGTYKIHDFDLDQCHEEVIEFKDVEPIAIVAPFTEKSSGGNEYITNFKQWINFASITPMEYKFNYHDMNSNIAADMDNLIFSTDRKYTVLTANTVFPTFENSVALTIDKFKGVAQIKVESSVGQITTIKEIQSDEITSVTIPCEGFESASQVNIVVALENSSDPEVGGFKFKAE